MIDRIVEALREAHAIGDPDQLDDYANAVLQALETAGDPILFINGSARPVGVADRFGPASWEISTDFYPGDTASWSRG